MFIYDDIFFGVCVDKMNTNESTKMMTNMINMVDIDMMILNTTSTSN